MLLAVCQPFNIIHKNHFFIREIWQALLRWIDELRIRKKRGPKWNESVLRNGKRYSDNIIRKTKKNDVTQKYNDLDKLYEEAAEAKKELDKITREFAYETGGAPGMLDETLNNGLKSSERALEKINSDYEGRAEDLIDISGSKIVYLTLEDLYKALKILDRKHKIIELRIEFKNQQQPAVEIFL